MTRLDNVISDIAYILDSLRVLRDIGNSGDCNTCRNRNCGYIPEVGEMVRYNCPFYVRKTDEINERRQDNM